MFYLYLVLAWVATFATGIFADCIADPNNPKPEAGAFSTFCIIAGFFWIGIVKFCFNDSPLIAFGPYAVATAINLIRMLNLKELVQFIGKVGP